MDIGRVVGLAIGVVLFLIVLYILLRLVGQV